MINALEIGQKYGHLTVLKEAPRGKQGEPRVICKCDCGYIGSFITYPILKGTSKHCRKCVPHSGGLPPPDIVGKIINGWEVLEDMGYESRSGVFVQKFRCRCTRCGHESIKTHGEMHPSKSDRCANCPPMFHFVVKGTSSTGILPNGTEFIIDTEDIPRVNQEFWRIGKDGYAYTGASMMLHRYLLGVTAPHVIVDHINRNRLDNRKQNLRIVSTFENSTNHSRLSNNKTGYIGVYYSRCGKRYEVKVGYNRKRIKLGSSKDNIILLAGMYNIAARYLFGEYVGELNDVPDPPQKIIDSVIEKCKTYKESEEASAISADAFPMEAAL